MPEISVSVAYLDTQIGLLRSLQIECSGLDMKSEDVVGGGQSIGVYQQVDEYYDTLKASFDELIGNTVSFLQDTRNKIAEADTKAAAGLSE